MRGAHQPHPVCVYLLKQVCVCVCVCMDLFVQSSALRRPAVCLWVPMCAFVCVLMCSHSYLLVCVCSQFCVCTCVSARACVCVFVCVFSILCVQLYVCACACLCVLGITLVSRQGGRRERETTWPGHGVMIHGLHHLHPP